MSENGCGNQRVWREQGSGKVLSPWARAECDNKYLDYL